MARKWTVDQKKAIEANEGRFLIAAGAGSGKTAVLTERIHRLLKDGKIHHLSELLVLTFTNKAAHEMKERTRQALMADPSLRNQADEVESADITTFDAFALSLVKKYHYDLGLPSDIAIMDENALQLKTREFLDEILAGYYSKKDPAFLDFIHHYTLKDDSVVVEMTLELLSQALLSGEPESFFENVLRDSYSPSFLKRETQAFYELQNKKLGDLVEDAHQFDHLDVASLEEGFLSSFLDLGSYDALAQKIAGQRYFLIPKQYREDLSFKDKALHSSLGSAFAEIRDSFASFGSSEDQINRISLTEKYAALWVELAKKLYEKLAIFKKEKGVYSFDDIAALARQAVAVPAISSSLRKRYLYTMVDEYQDTSSLQQRFLDSFNNGNFFAVGDIKQSIYRFRHADPSLFASLKKRFLSSGEGTLITLQDNFRSRKEVLEDINDIFSHAMSKALGEVTYDASEALGYGNRFLYEKSEDPRYHLETILYEKRDDLKMSECEARLIATDILQKVKTGFPLAAVNEGNEAVLRPCRFEDFAILIARKRDFPIYKRVFSEAKIPLDITADLDLANEDVSRLFLSFIALPLALDVDENRERHCYASIMRSYLYQEKDEDIYHDLTSGAYRNSPLFETLRSQKEEILRQENKKSVLFFFDTFPFFERLPFLGDVKENAEKLESFLFQAENFDRLGEDYKEFAGNFVAMKNYDVDLAIPALKATPASVRLMSVHASKGLEFPIVYVPDLSSKVNVKAIHTAFGYSPKQGFLIPLSLMEGNPYSILHYLHNEEEKEAELSERMRLYYVALTRAKEKLVLVERKEDNLEVVRLDPLHLLRIHSHPEKGEEDKTKGSIRPAESFLDFNRLSGLPFSFKETPVLDPLPLTQGEGNFENENAPERKQVSILPQEAPHIRASKTSLEPLDEGALSYGTALHRLLEVTDFRTKDTSFIKNAEDRSLIDKVLSLPLFSTLEKAMIYKEYAFYDEEKNLHGSIDLLLIYPEKAVIVDYKAKDIDDPHYREQLALYRSYIEKSFAKPVETYLLSIIGGELKKVE